MGALKAAAVTLSDVDRLKALREAAEGRAGGSPSALKSHALGLFDRASNKARELGNSARERLPGLIEAAKQLKARAQGHLATASNHVRAHPYAYGAAGLGAAGLLGHHVYKNLTESPEFTDENYAAMMDAARQGYEG